MNDFAVAIDKISKIVFSNTIVDVDWKTARLSDKSLEEKVIELKKLCGKDVFIGSRSLIIQLLNLNLLDEFQLCIHPMVEGKALALFEKINHNIIFKLAKTKIFNSGTIILYYEPITTKTMVTYNVSTYKTTINASVEKVWKALTNAEIVKQYFFGSNQETDWKIGSTILWTGEYEGTKYVDKGKVLEFLPNKKLSYSYLSSWSGLDDKPENYLLVSYEVKSIETGTELIITQSNYDEEKAKHSEGNWAVVIDGLKKLVE
ncbi:MAG: SRPBCC domain-containing protein [Ignavibacterium sp.]|nr:SRPBCC domain-containing protein [Ignavibacterium sp.]